MNFFTQTVLLIGRVKPEFVQPLGTGFLVSKDGKVATTRHVVGNDDKGLVVLFPHINNMNEYQDVTNKQAKPVDANIHEIDPIKDLAILDTKLNFDSALPNIGSFDNVDVSQNVGIFGFPHANDGRRVLTFQSAEIGAKVLLESNGIKSKYAIINVQARPGQSGSLIFDPKTQNIVGVLIGAYAPTAGGHISLGGIDPRELHQTTHCVSAHYIKEMID